MWARRGAWRSTGWGPGAAHLCWRRLRRPEKASDAFDAPVAAACVRRGKKMSLSFRKTMKHLRWSRAAEQACWARWLRRPENRPFRRICLDGRLHETFSVETCVYRHSNICNIQINFCNIQMKHLQHKCEIYETLETCW